MASLMSRQVGIKLVAGALVLAEAALLVAPAARGDALAHAEGSGGLKVVTFNCLGTNLNAGQVVGWVRAMKPDVVVFEEMPAGWAPQFASLSDILPYRASQKEDTPSDTDVFSRSPILAAQAYRPSPDLRALVHATVATARGPVEVFGLHPNTLQTPTEWRDRNAALELTGQWIAQTRGPRPAIALGDWNTPPWSPYFHRFLRIAGLKAADPVVWPPMTRVLAAPGGVRLGSSIDHVAASRGVRALGCETGPQMGSDHAPQICRLRLPD